MEAFFLKYPLLVELTLYLSKKICYKLRLEIKIESKYKEWTKIIIEFPKSGFNKID